VRTLKRAIPPKIATETQERFAAIAQIFASISRDLKGINVWRYQRQISPGIQEFMEAVSFEHYLRTQSLIRWEEASHAISEGIVLTSDDYVLGLFDLVGELMRFAITIMATSGSLPGTKEIDSSNERTILVDLRSLRTHFEALYTTSFAGTGLGKDVEKKMEVMKSCVEKVETAVYSMVIRGKERPKGWIPELVDDRPPLENY
jgi:predicted translin family RNA/ssDNA-binding protein